jgi:hypothetical protein
MRANFETGLKVCNACNIEQSVDLFYRNAKTFDRLQPFCKRCGFTKHAEWVRNNRTRAREINARWKKNNPERCLDLHRRCLYGISLEEIQKLREKQGGKCAICLVDFKDFSSACVDHCHTTGKVRGLLCNRCNHGLGHFRDNLSTLQRAIEYLKKI